MLHCCRCYAVYACQRIFTVENKMVWWRRKKLKFETLWFRTVKFFYSFQAKNYRKENYFFNASMVNIKEANRKCIDPSDVIVKCSFKNKDYLLYSTPTSLIENYAHKYGVWEPDLANFIHSVLQNQSQSGLFIDIGANVGATTIPQALNFPHMDFLCIEAHPTVFKVLKKNIKLNLSDNICCINGAVSNTSNGTKLNFYAQRSGANNLGLSSLHLNNDIEDYDVLSVKSIKVDGLKEANSAKVLMIKVDTQGSELDVLQSCVQIIRQNHPIIIFEFEEGYHDDPQKMRRDITKFFEELKYLLYTVPKSENVMFRLHLENYYRGDIVAVPNKDY